MDFGCDNRGLAVAIVAFFAMIIVAALLYILLDAAMGDLFTMLQGQAETSHGTDQIDLASAIWDNILFAMLGISVLFLIARAVVESRGPA